ncbi:MAG TPA: winged helix-turn-helix transcriptional regulator, partial [Candidatus Thermoplasmatota archaeon]|nr:winged helix-turn-helix transcriptional regulator [Candidatus Thermoplasmatota archaeon]
GTRERLLDAIRAQPGLAVADLAEAARVPRNTVTYHLRVLEREGLVSSTRQGRNRLFFAPGSLPQRASADALATLRHETTFAVAKAIGASPGVDQKALCAQIGLSPSLAHWHADRLVATGLIDKRREGRFVRYYPGASFELVAARAA